MVPQFDIYDDEPLLTSIRVSKQADVDEGISLLLQLLLWCSGWGAIDSFVQSVAADDLRSSFYIYLLIACIGCTAYCVVYKSSNSSVAEFLSLVLSCTGSWGLINCVVSMVAIGSKTEELIIHVFVFAFSGLCTFMHHKYRRPHSVLRQLVDLVCYVIRMVHVRSSHL